MPFNDKTTEEIASSIRTTVQSNLDLQEPLPEKGYTAVLAWAISGFLTLVQYVGNYWYRQMLIRTASFNKVKLGSKEFSPLIERGIANGTGAPRGATVAELSADITVITQGGQFLAGETLTGVNGYVYTNKTTVPLDAPTKTISVFASGDPENQGGVGAAGNLSLGDILSLNDAREDIVRDAPVSAIDVIAEDAQDPENYREQVSLTEKRKPQGGALPDYRKWGFDVGGITAIYSYTGRPGEVVNYVLASPESSGNPEGIPTQAQLDAVQNSLIFDASGLASRRPPEVITQVLPIAYDDFRVRVNGLQVQNESQVREQIEDAIRSQLGYYQPYIPGVSTERRDRVSRATIEAVVQRVAEANQGFISSVTVFVALPQIANFELQLPDAGDQCWTVRIAGNNEVTTQSELIFCKQAGQPAYMVLYFAGVTVPPNSNIRSARITFMSGASQSEVKRTMEITAVNSGSPVFSNAATDPTTILEPKISGAEPWTVGWFAEGVNYEMPELKHLVQHLVNRPDWNGNNPIKFLIRDTFFDVNSRTLRDVTLDTATNPLLEIEYELPTAIDSPIDIHQLSEGKLARLSQIEFVS